MVSSTKVPSFIQCNNMSTDKDTDKDKKNFTLCMWSSRTTPKQELEIICLESIWTKTSTEQQWEEKSVNLYDN